MHSIRFVLRLGDDATLRGSTTITSAPTPAAHRLRVEASKTTRISSPLPDAIGS